MRIDTIKRLTNTQTKGFVQKSSDDKNPLDLLRLQLRLHDCRSIIFVSHLVEKSIFRVFVGLRNKFFTSTRNAFDLIEII